MNEVYTARDLAYTASNSEDLKERIINHVQLGDSVVYGRDQIDSFILLLELVEDNPDMMNRLATDVLMGCKTNNKHIDEMYEKLEEMAEAMADECWGDVQADDELDAKIERRADRGKGGNPFGSFG